MSQTLDFPTPDELFPLLFEAVQTSNLFADSKTFVDCCPKTSPETIVALYKQHHTADDFDLKSFVHEHFNLPEDHASGFQSDSKRTAVGHVKALWPYLSRKGGDERVIGDSLIPIPHDYIVPGGRFGEIYYWDSYFTMLGLAESDRYDMIENMVKNCEFMIHTFGHIPNGNRTYFVSRSQPPFFVYMVGLLVDLKGTEVVDRYVKAIETEYRFWMYGDRYLPEWGVNRYWDDSPIPRQESFKEDVELSSESSRPPSELYRHLRAACESGWDFTSRWLADGMSLPAIEAADIVPVDLNALMYGLETFLIRFYERVGRLREKNAIAMNRQRRQVFLNHYCWDEVAGVYKDYHIKKQERTKVLSLATVYPLFCQMVDQKRADRIARTIETQFLKPGGLVTTLHHTGQQWDAPNGWAPLQWLAYAGLKQYGHEDLAADIARRWTALNEKVYLATGKFVEKYNVEDLDLEAGGGEYPVQDGFGWSNGVYLALKNELIKSASID